MIIGYALTLLHFYRHHYYLPFLSLSRASLRRSLHLRHHHFITISEHHHRHRGERVRNISIISYLGIRHYFAAWELLETSLSLFHFRLSFHYHFHSICAEHHHYLRRYYFPSFALNISQNICLQNIIIRKLSFADIIIIDISMTFSLLFATYFIASFSRVIISLSLSSRRHATSHHMAQHFQADIIIITLRHLRRDIFIIAGSIIEKTRWTSFYNIIFLLTQATSTLRIFPSRESIIDESRNISLTRERLFAALYATRVSRETLLSRKTRCTQISSLIIDIISSSRHHHLSTHTPKDIIFMKTLLLTSMNTTQAAEMYNHHQYIILFHLRRYL